MTSHSDPNREYLYGHLSARRPAGEYRAGEEIGKTGTTGNASKHPDRPHLHLEVWINGSAADPAPYFARPAKVVEAEGSPANTIDESAKPSCTPCPM